MIVVVVVIICYSNSNSNSNNNSNILVIVAVATQEHVLLPSKDIAAATTALRAAGHAVTGAQKEQY